MMFKTKNCYHHAGFHFSLSVTCKVFNKKTSKIISKGKIMIKIINNFQNKIH